MSDYVNALSDWWQHLSFSQSALLLILTGALLLALIFGCADDR